MFLAIGDRVGITAIAVDPRFLEFFDDRRFDLSRLAKGLSFGTAYRVSSSVSTSIRRSLPHKTFRFCSALSGSPSGLQLEKSQSRNGSTPRQDWENVED
jgi:hypothetical protein